MRKQVGLRTREKRRVKVCFFILNVRVSRSKNAISELHRKLPTAYSFIIRFYVSLDLQRLELRREEKTDARL